MVFMSQMMWTHNLYTSEVLNKGSSASGIFVFFIINVFKGPVDFS